VSRREFTRNQREEIVERAKNERGEICCERCHLALGSKPFEIDHTIAEALRPEADKKAKITIAEGQLLGRDCCHRGDDGKTNKDVAKIAKAKRQNAAHLGIKTAPQKPLQGRGFPKTDKPKTHRPSLPPRCMYAPVGALWPQPKPDWNEDRNGD
jgi:cytochrome c